jgi:hypothetical protein
MRTNWGASKLPGTVAIGNCLSIITASKLGAAAISFDRRRDAIQAEIVRSDAVYVTREIRAGPRAATSVHANTLTQQMHSMASARCSAWSEPSAQNGRSSSLDCLLGRAGKESAPSDFGSDAWLGHLTGLICYTRLLTDGSGVRWRTAPGSALGAVTSRTPVPNSTHQPMAKPHPTLDAIGGLLSRMGVRYLRSRVRRITLRLRKWNHDVTPFLTPKEM